MRRTILLVIAALSMVSISSMAQADAGGHAGAGGRAGAAGKRGSDDITIKADKIIFSTDSLKFQCHQASADSAFSKVTLTGDVALLTGGVQFEHANKVCYQPKEYKLSIYGCKTFTTTEQNVVFQVLSPEVKTGVLEYFIGERKVILR